jgi:hypothetical protein
MSPDIFCSECNQMRPKILAIHWGDGKVRCGVCSSLRSAWFAERRANKRARALCTGCGIKTGGPDICENCCEHGDMDRGTCLDCGADRREDLMAQAYDRAKDIQKYGDT